MRILADKDPWNSYLNTNNSTVFRVLVIIVFMCVILTVSYIFRSEVGFKFKTLNMWLRTWLNQTQETRLR